MIGFLKRLIKKTIRRTIYVEQILTEQEDYWSEVVGEYLGSPRTGALAITGEWGSGKTHLYKNTIRSVIERSGRKCLYVSLYSYGVSGKSIDDFLIEELSGVKDVDDASKSGASSLLTGLFTSTISDTKNAGMIGSAVMAVGGAIKKRILDALDSYVLCFDDLDRLSPENFKKVWSEINYFSEFKSRKVILLLDETKLVHGSVHAPEYEKNIWRSVPIRMTPANALDQALELMSSEWSNELTNIKQTHLMPVVDFFNIKNIRTIWTSLELLRRLHLYQDSAGADEKIDRDKLAVLYQNVFLVSLTSVIRGRKTEEHKTTLRSLCGGYHRRKLHMMMKSNKDSSLSEEDKFIQSLPDFDCSNVIDFSFVYDYLMLDELDVEALTTALRVKRRSPKDFSNRPICQIYESLSDRSGLGEASYLAYVNSAVETIANPAPGVCNIKKLANIISEFMYDCKMGGMHETPAELESIFQAAVAKWHDVIGVDGYSFEDGAEDFFMFRQGNSDVPSLEDELLALDKAAKECEARARYLERLENWHVDEGLTVFQELANQYDMPLFKYISEADLESFLQNSNGKTLGRFNAVVSRRFAMGGAVSVIRYERDMLLKLQEMYSKATGYGPRRIQFNEGYKIVGAALENINNL
jgi:hypothetical protein